MKKLCLALGMLLAVLLTGCAFYQAPSLSALDPECIRVCPEIEGLLVGCRVYSKQDCLDYLDRDVMRKGYQPIQLTFQNMSDKHYGFSIEEMSLSCEDPQSIAKAVHTSTTGRVTGYALGGLLFSPLFIPAIVDGIKSSNANTALDKDFGDKAREHFVISPGAFKKTLIFVKKSKLQPILDITLFEQETKSYKTVRVALAY